MFYQIHLVLCFVVTLITLVPVRYLVFIPTAIDARGIHVHFELELASRCERTVGTLELFVLAIVMNCLHVIFQVWLGKGHELAFKAFFGYFLVHNN